MKNRYRLRRYGVAFGMLAVVGLIIATAPESYQLLPKSTDHQMQPGQKGPALDALSKIAIKGRAPKTGYERTQFGDGWQIIKGCSTRDIILHRDMTDTAVGDGCKTLSGTLNDPYTGKMIVFKRGASTSSLVQIDHVVALSDAWQKGAQQLSAARREQLANDPLELLAVDGKANQDKSDGDAATWLPPNKAFRCQYVARQIAVKVAYDLWMTQAEHDATAAILQACPAQSLPSA